VNRVWKHHFGEGLVKSVDDFGHMGELPSHPELLDDLACRFVKEGWSLKKLHREIVLSRTYRQNSLPTDQQAAHLDPQGRFLSHMPVQRLDAEAVRDALLAISGQLKPGLCEAGVMPYLTPLMQGRGRPPVSGPLDGAGRRSIYLSVRRNFLPPLFCAFDFPTPFSTMGRRSVSNVPAQSLALMNDPFVVDQARRWAEAEPSQDRPPEKRLDTFYLHCFSRRPTQAERDAALQFLHTETAAQAGRSEQAWASLAHALFCTKEFIFIP
jgi:hypothetical protein